MPGGCSYEELITHPDIDVVYIGGYPKEAGRIIPESSLIIEYLDETRGGGVLPADPVGRARARALACAGG